MFSLITTTTPETLLLVLVRVFYISLNLHQLKETTNWSFCGLIVTLLLYAYSFTSLRFSVR